MANRTLLRQLLLLAGLTTPLPLAGCGGSSCDELADICATCPADGDGPAAKESCLRAVAEDTEAGCSEKVERRSYAPFGCK